MLCGLKPYKAHQKTQTTAAGSADVRFEGQSSVTLKCTSGRFYPATTSAGTQNATTRAGIDILPNRLRKRFCRKTTCFILLCLKGGFQRKFGSERTQGQPACNEYTDEMTTHCFILSDVKHSSFQCFWTILNVISI